MYLGIKNTVLILFLFLLSFEGCSTSYKISNYSSKHEYYKNYNEFASSREMEVTLTNDSSFEIGDSSILKDDSLFLINKKLITNIKILPVPKIKEISYKNRWLGIIPGAAVGFSAGAVVGFIGGVILTAITYNSGPPHPHLWDQHVGALIGGGAFGFIGGIIGWIEGVNYTYNFN